MGDAGTEIEMILCARHVGKLANGRDVDQEFRLGDPQIEHWPERLASGDDFRKDILLAEQVDCILDAGCALVIEGNRFHGRLCR